MCPSNKEAPETIKITYLIKYTIRILILQNQQEAIANLNSIAGDKAKKNEKKPEKNQKKT
jgi:hypothetical protein